MTALNHQELRDRVFAALVRGGHQHPEDIVDAIERAGIRFVVPAQCDTFWGSHGCDLKPGHDGPHVCGAHDSDGPCSTHDGELVRHCMQDGTLSTGAPSSTFTNLGILS